MAKQISTNPFAIFTLRPGSATPLHKQLYEQVRKAILTGQLASGTRLPSTRILASELAVSRNTVTGAFRQLMAEGYLEGRVGDGTYVVHALPDELLNSAIRRPEDIKLASGSRRLSNRAAALVEMPVDLPLGLMRTTPGRPGAALAEAPVDVVRNYGPPRPFRYGSPALDRFPYELWSRLVTRFWRSAPSEVLGYRDLPGYRPLREAVSMYLQTGRAVKCDPEQVLIVNGTQQALDLSARVLIDPGDSVWVENPCYNGVRGAFAGAGAQLIPVPVDSEGLNVAAGIQRAPKARMAFVAPSHQYPLGVTMPLHRRLELLNWAQQSGAWILEDDYDSESRYTGPPLTSLQGLDTNHRVIYMGSFSKVLFPALRLGYLVVPPDLVEAFAKARAFVDRQSPIPEQVILARFMEEGHFTRHIRRMRMLYAQRQEALIEAASKHLSGLLDIFPAEAGMHVMGWLQAPLDDREASRIALEHGVEAPPLSAYCLEPYHRQGLLIGYAAFNEQEINHGVKRLADALRALL